jgi:ABC-type branched-subunit amino acid transport system ATPase component
MLVAEGLSKHFSGVVALQGVDMQVTPGEIVGLVGPNGSGKSTLLNTLSGFIRADTGKVIFHGQRIERRRPWDIATRGLQRTFQLPTPPQRMTVLEVMLTGARLPRGATMTQSLLRPRRVRAEQRQAIERAAKLLDDLTLLDLQHHAAGSLSGGQQKLLALGVALMSDPDLLLLDEPTAGVNRSLRRALVDRLRAVNEAGTALVIVEHDMGFVGELCARVYVLDKGEVLTCCGPSELVTNPRVVEAYLGSHPERGTAVPGARGPERDRGKKVTS